ncbi:MAG: hypothetical protein OSA24_08640 [Longimicrobiales bacterium]|jgi:hypothetical protein|nr:hypothetical protein [Longimicrobiales bacterium]|tara:strand:+ start:1053 stop:1451 length:399 start_codon:yes stop_codon:yes gene_type:complete
MTIAKLEKHIDKIEESYEFFLAYAAQGVSGDQEPNSDLVSFLEATETALAFLQEELHGIMESLTPSSSFTALADVVRQDALKTRAAVGLVMVQPAISSQLIDNLNASIHFRALLTDLFLLDEAMKTSIKYGR